MIVVIMGNEHGREAQVPDPGVIKTDIGKGVAIAAERIFEQGIESDLRSVALEHITGVQYPGNFQAHGVGFIVSA